MIKAIYKSLFWKASKKVIILTRISIGMISVCFVYLFIEAILFSTIFESLPLWMGVVISIGTLFALIAINILFSYFIYRLYKKTKVPTNFYLELEELTKTGMSHKEIWEKVGQEIFLKEAKRLGIETTITRIEKEYLTDELSKAEMKETNEKLAEELKEEKDKYYKVGYPKTLCQWFKGFITNYHNLYSSKEWVNNIIFLITLMALIPLITFTFLTSKYTSLIFLAITLLLIISLSIFSIKRVKASIFSLKK